MMHPYPISADKPSELSPRHIHDDISVCPPKKKQRALSLIDPVMAEQERIRKLEKEEPSKVDSLMAEQEFFRKLEKENACAVDPAMAEQEYFRQLEKEDQL